MQTDYTEDQHQFKEVVARFMGDKSKIPVVRELMATDQGFDPAVWQQLCGEVGLAGTPIPEAYGGFGFGPVELGIVAEQMGRHLFCGPYFASVVMAGNALLVGGTEAAKERLLPGIADGSNIATLVLDDVNGPDTLGGSIRADDNGCLTGTAAIVLDAHVADLLIVMAGTSSGLAIFSADPKSQDIAIELLETIDATRKVSRVSFSGSAAEKIGEFNADQVSRMWDQMSVALAHEMIGGAQILFDSTIDYTRMRYQFGRPIGSFQGLKHRCADQLLELELAKATVRHASFCLAADEGEPYAASMAKAMAADAYMNVARMAIQLRGGIGFTWEEDTHLWYKRAKSSEVFLGSPAVHRERMMQQLEAQA